MHHETKFFSITNEGDHAKQLDKRILRLRQNFPGIFELTNSDLLQDFYLKKKYNQLFFSVSFDSPLTLAAKTALAQPTQSLAELLGEEVNEDLFQKEVWLWLPIKLI